MAKYCILGYSFQNWWRSSLNLNRNDLRRGAKKKLQCTHENWGNISNTWKFSFLRPHKRFPTSFFNNMPFSIKSQYPPLSIVGSVSLQKWQNSALQDKAFRIGQCCGSGSESGSGRIRVFWSDPDPDPPILVIFPVFYHDRNRFKEDVLSSLLILKANA